MLTSLYGLVYLSAYLVFLSRHMSTSELSGSVWTAVDEGPFWVLSASLILRSACAFCTLVIAFCMAAALSRIDGVGGSCSVMCGYASKTSRVGMSLLGLVVLLIALMAIWSIDLELTSGSLSCMMR